MGLMSLYVLKKRIQSIRPMMKDPTVSFWKKAVIVGGLIYLFLPFDLIPPMVPVFGFFDDAVLWAFILSYLKDDLDRYWADERVDGAHPKKYSGKNIVDNVDYTVEEETYEEIKDESKQQKD